VKARIIRYVVCGLIVAACAAAIVSLVTYDQGDLQSEKYPVNDPLNNLCGRFGAFAAHLLYEWLGFVAFGALGIVVYWSVATVVTGTLEKKALRIIGAAIFVASGCGFAQSLPYSPPWLPGNGGLMGRFYAALLVPILGRFLFGIVFACLTFLSLCLATDTRLAPAAGRGLVALLRRIGGLLSRRGEGAAPVPRPARTAPAPVETGPPPPAEEPEPSKKPAKKRRARKKPPPEEPKSAPAVPKTRGGYVLPGPELLTPPEPPIEGTSAAALKEESEVLCKTLADFDISAEVVDIEVGPVVVQYQLELAAGTKVHKVQALSDDLAMALKTPSVRIVAPIPGKSAVGIEVPNKKRALVRLSELFEEPEVNLDKYEIPLLLGKDTSGSPVVSDMAEMPHLLIAGATGSGKTICLNTIIMSMLMTQHPKDLKLLLVDPKMVEMACFKDIPHLISPVVTDMKKAPDVLNWAATKMDERYDVLAEAGVRSIVDYNSVGAEELESRSERELPERLPYIIIMIDELADLMSVSAKEVESSITRLAQKSRAVGIHIVLATQRPSVDVITGLIKSNLPSRVSFRVTSKIDSRTILDRNGAEKLLGQGDLLMIPPGSTDMIRAQGTYVSDDEVQTVVDFIKAQAEPEYYEDLMDWEEPLAAGGMKDDPLFNDAARVIIESQRGSASLLQRRLGIGYTRASRLVDMMEDEGIVGGHKEAQARKVLLTIEEWEQRLQAESEDEQPSP
jgi:S-DNA-T family DNA segregation ATPase FtsK/SpoIIIE